MAYIYGKNQKQEEFECDCCGRVLTPTQMKIEKKINTDLSPCRKIHF